MAWFQDLAGKAETFLNTLDNSAAQALNKSQESVNYTFDKRTDPFIVKDFDQINDGNHISNTSDSIKSLPLKLSQINSPKPIEIGDDRLFQFSNGGKLNDQKSRKMLSDNASDKESSGYRTSNEDVQLRHNTTEIMSESNNAQIENKLLRSEISSLNQEISSLLQRNHKTEEECKRLKNLYEKVSGQLRDTDKKLRQLQSEMDDLEESLRARQTKVDALQQELGQLRRRGADQSTADVSNLVSDHRNRILSLEQELLTKGDQIDQLESNKAVLQAAVDDAKIRMSQSINSYNKQQANDRRKIESLVSQLNSAKAKTEHAIQELKDYKTKATRILQMKEKVITGMRSGGSSQTDAELGISGGVGNSTTDGVHEELTQLSQECDQLREEAARARVELEHKEFDLQELDQQFHSETESLRRNVDLLEEQLDREKQLREDLDSDNRQLSRDLRQLQERCVREKADLHELLLEREAEVGELRQQSEMRQDHEDQLEQQVSGGSKTESRIRSLTDAVLQKQAALDSSRSDCHSLTLRLERCEAQLASYLRVSASGVTGSGRGGQSGAGLSTNMMDLIGVSVRDTPAMRTVKSAINNLDRVSQRVGVVLRRYPPVRLCFMLYCLVLHLWVLFVLATYQPEIHTSSGVPAVAPSAASGARVPEVPVGMAHKNR